MIELGVCYYPEHWPSTRWAEQARQMRELGLGVVRVGEFAWSRLEPARDRFEFEWLDQAIKTLAEAGLKVILCTPTACPPKWLTDSLPEVLPVGADGRSKQFGSRRHYCFSSPAYQHESDRIVTALAERYGEHPAVVGWQLDNEFGHHDTTLSYSTAAIEAFRAWCLQRYGSIEALNEAWGNVFWSMEYPSFEAIDPPMGAVTETNPAHRLAWRRFSSDQVVAFSARQAAIVRQHINPDVWLTHNFIGHFTEFDHYDLAKHLDMATWDSYPLGFLEQLWFDEQTINTYRRTGHPDLSAFQHDLYRGVGAAGGGRWGVMEQQPGPVNWAPHNARPLAGMVRFWAFEAIAHGADLMSFFRWQQAPFAQEQMHAGLTLPNGMPATAYAEVKRFADELRVLDVPANDCHDQSNVAIVFDYGACWISQIQPQSADYNACQVVFEWYSAARQLGLNIDIVSADAALDRYQLLLLPALLSVNDTLVDHLAQSGAQVLIGPRAGSKTTEYSIPEQLPPGPLQQLIDLQVTEVDTLRPGAEEYVRVADQRFPISRWLETVQTEIEPSLSTEAGQGISYRQGNIHYLAGVGHTDLIREILRSLCQEIGLPVCSVSGGLRMRRRGKFIFAFNSGPDQQVLPVSSAALRLGQSPLAVGDVAVWLQET